MKTKIIWFCSGFATAYITFCVWVVIEALGPQLWKLITTGTP